MAATSHSSDKIVREMVQQNIRFSDRVACPVHGAVMVLVRHELSEMGERWSGIGTVTFFRCTGMVDFTDDRGRRTRRQCTFMRPNKYQCREKGERHK